MENKETDTNWRAKIILHTLRAYVYYLHRLSYCNYSKFTADYINSHWDEDYKFIEGSKDSDL